MPQHSSLGDRVRFHFKKQKQKQNLHAACKRGTSRAFWDHGGWEAGLDCSSGQSSMQRLELGILSPDQLQEQTSNPE